MSAIVGLWNTDSNPDLSGIDSMLRGVARYGEGVPRRWVGDCVALGRWLIPSTPEDEFDQQPYAVCDGHVQVVADVRLDNRSELIDLLRVGSRDASVLADAALVARAWERWQDGALSRIVGDFALVVWDARHHRLHLARDFVGSRPLFYYRGRGVVACATMPSGLRALPGIPSEIDETGLARAALRVRGWDDRSVYRSILRVRPGELITCSASDVHRSSFWRPESIAQLRLSGPDEYAAALREVWDRAVTSRLRGHGDVGSHLSAGLDSSTVTASAAMALAGGRRRVVAFTAAPRMGYAAPESANVLFDESGHAAAVAAQHSNIDHVILRSDRSLFDGLAEQARVYQQPLLNPCNHVWLEDILTAARARGIRTLLTGWMGNATISFRDPVVLRSLASSGQWLTLVREASALVGQGHASWSGLALRLAGPAVPAGVIRGVQRLRGRHGYDSNTGPLVNRRWFHEVYRGGRRPDSSVTPFGFDPRLAVLSAGDLGAHQKACAGGWQVDVRNPAADRRVFEFCLAIPPTEFVRGGVPAALLRRAFGGQLPGVLLNERRRGLQAADWHERLVAGRRHLDETLMRIEQNRVACRILDVPELRRLAEHLPGSGWHRPDITAIYRYNFLRAIAIGHFACHVSDGGE